MSPCVFLAISSKKQNNGFLYLKNYFISGNINSVNFTRLRMNLINTIHRMSIQLVFLILLTCSTRAVSDNASNSKLILIVTSSDSPFYTPTREAFEQSLKHSLSDNGLKCDFRKVYLTGNTTKDNQALQSQENAHPQLVLSLGTLATVDLFNLHSSIPTLFSSILDPVSLGVVKTNREPGSNFTGTVLLVDPGKQLETLQLADPLVKRVGVLYTNNDPTSVPFLKKAELAASNLHMTLVSEPVSSGDDIDSDLNKLNGSVDAMWVIADPASTGPDALQATLTYCSARKLPILGLSSATVHAGALISLSPNITDLGALTAEMASSILSGNTQPATLSVRGPRATILSINLDVANKLGIHVPSDLLHLADDVVDSNK